MNELVLREMNQDHVLYLYQPEGKGEYGEILYSFSERKARAKKMALEDISGRYALKACYKVEECVSKNNLPIRFTQAWY